MNATMKRMRHAAVVLAATVAAVVMAADSETVQDLTVAEGESLTLSGTAEYGRIVVNGDLVIAQDAVITAASLCVATNITGTASLVMEEDSALSVTDEGVNTVFGITGGKAYVEMKSGSHFNANSGAVHIAVDVPQGADLAEARIVASNAVFETQGIMEFPKGRSGSIDKTVAEIRLDEGSVVKAKGWRKVTLQAVKILFNGGAVQTRGWNGEQSYFAAASNNGSVFSLEATNGCPVSVAVGHSVSCLFGVSSLSAVIEVCGDGDFLVSGANRVRLATKSSWNDNIRFRNSGALRISNPNAFIEFSGFFRDTENSPAKDIVIEDGGRLDIRACEALAKSLVLMGSGTVTNAETGVSTLTLGVGDGDSVFSRKLPPRMNVVKKGSGTLTMFASDAGSVKVEEGGLKLMSREVMGYPIYRFNVYSTGNIGKNYARVHIGELNFLQGETDATQGWDELYYDPTGTSYYNEPLKMLDGDLSTYFYDQRAQSFSNVSNIHVSLEYAIPRKMTGYRWNRTTADKDTHSRCPTSWAVLGSEDNVNWRLLSHVEYLESSWSSDWRTYPCTNYPATSASIAGLDLAAGAKLTVCGPSLSLTAAGIADDAVISVSDGARLVLPDGCTVSNLAADRDAGGGTLVNFNPGAEGALYVTGGTGSARGPLPVMLEDPVSTDIGRWKVYVDGNLNENVAAAVIDGRLYVVNAVGLVITVK